MTEYRKTVMTLKAATTILRGLGYKTVPMSKLDMERNKGDMEVSSPYEIPEFVAATTRRDAYFRHLVLTPNGKIRILGDDKIVPPDPVEVAKLVIKADLEDILHDVSSAKNEVARWGYAFGVLSSIGDQIQSLDKHVNDPGFIRKGIRSHALEK